MLGIETTILLDIRIRSNDILMAIVPYGSSISNSSANSSRDSNGNFDRNSTGNGDGNGSINSDCHAISDSRNRKGKNHKK